MTDLVVTVPKKLWAAWLEEGDLPGEQWSGQESHFWIGTGPVPPIAPGERVYVVAGGKVRGYAPLVEYQRRCPLNQMRSCLLRHAGAVAMTVQCQGAVWPYCYCKPCLGHPSSWESRIAEVRGYQSWRKRWWPRSAEIDFPGDWRTL